MRINMLYKILLTVGVFTLLAAAIIFGVIWPTVHYINKLNKEAYDLRVYMEKRYQIILKMRTSTQNFDTIKTEVEQYSNYIFSVGDDLKLITTLEDLAAKNNVEQKIKYTAYSKKPGQEVNFSLSASGDYTNVLRHLSDIEKIRYFFNIKQIQFTPVFSRTGETSSSTVMTLTIGFYAN